MFAFAGCSTPGGSDASSDEQCATLITGEVHCGDDLVRWCVRNYDPQINANICRATLRDAGYEPRTIARRNAQREEEQITGIKTEDTRPKRGNVGDILSLAGENSQQRVAVKVRSIKHIQPDEYEEPKGELIGVEFVIVNKGSKVLDDGPTATVVLDNDRQVDVAFTSSPECDTGELQTIKLAPGARRVGCIPFEVRDSGRIRAVQFSANYGNGQLGEWRVGSGDVQ